MGERRTTAAVLAALARPDRRFDLAPALGRVRQPDRLLAVVARHRLVGALHDRIREVEGVDPDLRARLARADLENRAAQARVLQSLGAVAAALDGAGIPWLAVKGAVLAHGAYPSASLRRAGDIDLLVGPDRLWDAMAALHEHAGAVELDRNWAFAARVTAGEVHLELANGVVVDLHWHLLYEAEERRRFGLPTGELLARRRTVGVGSLEVPTLDPVDTVIHLAYHASKEGADRLGWIIDIARAIDAWPVAWDRLVDRAVGWRLGLPVAVALQRAALVAGADVPDWVVPALTPAPWRMATRVVDRLAPITGSARGRDGAAWARTRDVVPAIVGHAAAAVPGAPAAARWAVARFGRDVLDAVFAPMRGAPSRTVGDADDLAVEAGGDDARSRFLSEVAREAGVA